MWSCKFAITMRKSQRHDDYENYEDYIGGGGGYDTDFFRVKYYPTFQTPHKFRFLCCTSVSFAS